MAKTNDETKPAPARRLKRCECGATVFQGPHFRGPIVNGAMERREELYACVHCHRVWALADLAEHDATPALLVE